MLQCINKSQILKLSPMSKNLINLALLFVALCTTNVLSADVIIKNEISNYDVEGELRSIVGRNIKRLIDVGTYRGRRHKMGLPTRGQNTKNNSRTRKGKKKTVAGKKGV